MIRSTENRGTEPDKYIKVPITSDNVKIIEIRPDPVKKTKRLSDADSTNNL